MLSLAGDVAARFEAGADSSVGGGRRSTRSIAKEVGVQPRIVGLWRHRYADHGLEGLQDKPRPGKQPIYTKTTDKRILKLLDKPPPQGFARWTGPLLAEALGDVDVQFVWRFLRSHKIDLAARKSWCESTDPNFTAKAADVVGLYVAPPAKAIVLCVDEKPSIQALERAQGYRKDNPVEHTERGADSTPYIPWPPEAFALWFEHARVDMHLPVYSALFTGQRKETVLNMLRPKSDAKEIQVYAQKIKSWIPTQIHSEYRQIIDAVPVDPDKPQLKLHLMANGQPWTYEGWKTAWQRELEKDDGKGPLSVFAKNRWVFHGLRKNAVIMLLEVGCTEDQVSAIVGMSPAMVRHYAKEVSKFRLARSAMKLLEDGWEEQRVHVLGAAKKPE